MKKILLVVCILATFQLSNAQAYKGKGDTKFQVGANFQDGGAGITSTFDLGIGENMSFGAVATYLLNAKEIAGSKARFEDRADIKARFNANIGTVLGLDSKMILEIVRVLEAKCGHDFYPTLLFEYQTIQDLSEYLLEQDATHFETNEQTSVGGGGTICV